MAGVRVSLCSVAAFVDAAARTSEPALRLDAIAVEKSSGYALVVAPCQALPLPDLNASSMYVVAHSEGTRSAESREEADLNAAKNHCVYPLVSAVASLEYNGFSLPQSHCAALQRADSVSFTKCSIFSSVSTLRQQRPLVRLVGPAVGILSGKFFPASSFKLRQGQVRLNFM